MPGGSLLYRNLLTYQLYGANTDVGKTVWATILCKAFSRFRQTWYLKPVSTGPGDEADDRHVQRFASRTATRCLYQFGQPVSPHIAAAAVINEAVPPPTDRSIVNGILEHVQSCSQSASGATGVVLIETAGGVHSPAPSGASQADLYRPLRLPIMLVADSRLGGISSTISAFESLHVRGYDLDSVLVFQNDRYQNHGYLSTYFKDRGVTTLSLPPPPTRKDGVVEDEQEMGAYYERSCQSDDVAEFLSSCHDRHTRRIERLESMAAEAKQKIWYPFTQHRGLEPASILTIDSGHGDFFQTLTSTASDTEDNGTAMKQEAIMLRPTFDASASWWTQGLGHGSPTLSLAAAYAAGRYGHVMFAGAINEPALSLAELLLKHNRNPRLQKVFYSDNGSTGMEVAIKMALTASSRRYGWDESIEQEDAPKSKSELGIIGLRGSYHGDTIGAMDLSEQSAYNQKVHWYKGRGYWFDFPQVKLKKGKWIVESPSGMEKIFGVTESFQSLQSIFDRDRDQHGKRALYEHYIRSKLLEQVREHGLRFGALVIEPILLGAGGMLFCDPLFQRTLVDVVRSSQHIFAPASNATSVSADTNWQGLPVIFDEVFTGLYRLGHFSPSALLQVHPDISVHAKLLTGGLVPLCTTLASNSIYEAFLSDNKSDALLHGHSYTAHAVGCEVARTSVQTMLNMDERGQWDIYKRKWTERTAKPGTDPKSSRQALHSDDTVVWSMWDKDFVTNISQQEKVESVIALGSVLAISLHDQENAGYTSMAAVGLQRTLLREAGGERFNVHSRVLGNVLYLMASQTSEVGDLGAIERRMLDVLSNDG
ncbi:MAG: hypothetical protein M1818_007950 [Claussenomyces sp. TS43310]|nr:MAG: hypothetical protein M1818_007950 [Claussenomyces sp. TS43310]